MAEASQSPSLVNVNDNGVGLTLRLIIIAESSVVTNPPRQRWKRWVRDTPMLHVPRERHTVRRAIHEASQHGVDVVIFRPPQMDGVKGKEAHLAKTKEIDPKSAIIISAMYNYSPAILTPNPVRNAVPPTPFSEWDLSRSVACIT